MDHTAEVEGVGMGVGPDGERVPAVLLMARDEYLPILVTGDQAESIRMGVEGEPFERPLTHDLLVNIVTEFGGALDGVRIDDVRDGTFYAKIDAQRYDQGEAQPFVFDARPSDAIALAVRADCEITVSDEVLDIAGRDPSELEIGDGNEGPGGQGGWGGPDEGLDDW